MSGFFFPGMAAMVRLKRKEENAMCEERGEGFVRYSYIF